MGTEVKFQVGDIVECVEGQSHRLTAGALYTVTNVDGTSWIDVDGHGGWYPSRFILHSRPFNPLDTPLMEAVRNGTLPAEDDPINHPPHYARWKMEPIEFIMINDLPAWLANVIKYTMRYDAKDGIKDLYKGRSYLDMKIRQLEGIPRYWEKPVSEERKLNAA